MTTETPEALTRRICEAIVSKLARHENCLKLIQFDVTWLLSDLWSKREAAEAKLAAAKELAEADQPAQGDLFGEAA